MDGKRMTEKMKSFVKGILLGLCGHPLPQGKEPVAYLYNGVRLPKLPESELPYAVITVGEDTAVLMFRSEPPTLVPTFNFLSPTFVNKDEPTFSYQLAGGSEWVEHDGYIANQYADWTNTDIFKDDGSVYLTASEPVPVYE
jgi:hypothetical protein